MNLHNCEELLRRTKSILSLHREMDCFAALVMTGKETGV